MNKRRCRYRFSDEAAKDEALAHSQHIHKPAGGAGSDHFHQIGGVVVKSALIADKQKRILQGWGTVRALTSGRHRTVAITFSLLELTIRHDIYNFIAWQCRQRSLFCQ